MVRILVRIGIAGILFALAAWWGASMQSEPSRTPVAAPPVTTTSPLATEAPVAPAPSRVRLPRPVTPPTRRVTRRVVTPETPASGGPVDRREGAPDDGGALLAEVRANLDLVREDIAECVAAWDAAAIDGRVLLAFRFDADGLQDAWLSEVESVPDGPRTCFASAVYDVDWAGMTDSPVEVTIPYVVTTE